MITYKHTLWLTSILAAIIFITGYFIPLEPSGAENSSDMYADRMSFGELLSNNLKVSLSVIIFGGLTLGFYYLMYLLQNFLSMAMIISHLNSEHSVWNTLSTFVIHGIFEIPAMLMSASLGLYIPVKIVYLLIKKKPIIAELKKIPALIGIIILLIVAAAVLEAFVSPIFMKV
ncbi:stage II sporulation protein M [Lentibacillus persicus]|uniref:Stage II sporulation protein M n=1 Tax=Lentibacillus persicus TaxID=640948 RepID=A0A1I1X8V9_9BACI|nr:stage II sporulation protein M [Lentibacillus persicus]SFE03038.1 stage II sporulation protein M [Lentibacillus persicus]